MKFLFALLFTVFAVLPIGAQSFSTSYSKTINFPIMKTMPYSIGTGENQSRALKSPGSFPNGTQGDSTLKLTYPNGGEVFVAESDTVITWEGVAAADTVTLEFSNDNGITWKTLSTTATGLRYVWKNVPQPESDRCLVRVSLSGKNTDNSPTIEWQKTYGGSERDEADCIRQTVDSGYIVSGLTYSVDGDLDSTLRRGNRDSWILKLDKDGKLLWQKTLGVIDDDHAHTIMPTSDRGYVVAVATPHDYLIVKLDDAGNFVWQKTFDGSNGSGAYSVQQTVDGGYVTAGYINPNKVQGDYWVVKLDLNGNLEWQKAMGGSKGETATSIHQTVDMGYIVGGITYSNDGDVTGKRGTTEDTDCWIVKLDSNGKIEWQRVLGGSKFDYANDIQQTFDGGYIIAGHTNSNDGDITDLKGPQAFWVVKLDRKGNIQWEKTFEGSEGEAAYSIQQTVEGGYIAAGYTASSDGDIIGKHVSWYEDAWIVKLDPNGKIEWQKVLGGEDWDEAWSIQQTLDLGYVVAGFAKSISGDITENKGDRDLWIVKLSSDSNTILQSDTSDATFSIVLPPPDSLGVKVQPDTIDFGKVMVGSHRDTVNAVSIFNVGTIPFTVSNIRLVGPNDFTLLSASGSFNLLPGQVLRAIGLRFTPSAIGQISGRLLFDVSGAATPFEVILTGDGIADTTAVDAILSAPVLAARAGEELTVPITLQDLARVIQSGASRVTVNLRFNSTLLEPIGATPLGTLSGNDRVIPLDITLKPDAQGVVARLPFRAAFGNDSVTVLRLESPAVVGSKVSVSTSAGEFHLLGICYAGGARLLNPGGVVTLALAGQNPVGEQAEIELETTESGTTTLVLFDTGGREVRRYIAGEVSTGRRSVSLDMRGIPAGLYMLTLQTPTETRTAQIRITR